jgi:hypothetical protein
MTKNISVSDKQLSGFLYADKDWFTKKYSAKSAVRFSTFKTALNLFMQRGGGTIVETGCVRQADDYGAGMSTVMFCDYLSQHGGHIWTVDLSPKNIAICADLTKEFESVITLVADDSIHFLQNLSTVNGFPGSIDLLYLDSYDYPYGDLLDIYGGKTDISKAVATLQSMTEEAILAAHSELILPCQTHCLNELVAAAPFLHDKSIILIDDNMLSGGGKPRLAKQWLMNNNYELLYDGMQTLWIKRTY